MLDINLIRNNPNGVAERLAKKGCVVDFTEFLGWDNDRKKLIQESETLKAERNNNSALVPQYKKEGKDVAELIAKTKEIGIKIGEVDGKLSEIEERINDFLCRLPNMPDEDLLAGEKENNKVIYTFGNKPEFSFVMER